MVRFALLSAWHVHTGWFAGELLKSGLGKYVVVWDEDEARGRKFADEFGADFDPDLDHVLAREDVDAVMVECPTTQHKEVIIKAANAGKHIFSDKTLALTVADCREIRRAVEANGVKFVVSLESKTIKPYRYIAELVQAGKLGRITSVYFRRAHDAALKPGNIVSYWFDRSQTGGGATLDLGCHGLYLLPQLCGKPKKVSCLMTAPFGTGSDEISTTIVEFENGAVGTAFTSYLTSQGDDLLEVLGTEGKAVVPTSQLQEIRVLLQSNNIEGYETLKPVPGDWGDDEMPIVQFARLVESDAQSLPAFDLDAAEQLARMIECAYESAETGRAVEF